MNDITIPLKQVRTKTVREVTVPKSRIRPWRPYYLLDGSKWGCDCVPGDSADVSCTRCYGTGVPGGYEMKGLIDIVNAVYEEVVDAGGTPRWEDEFVSLNFETVFQSWIFSGCIFTFDRQFWKVTGVTEIASDETDDGVFLPDRWDVYARLLEQHEGAYYFLEQEDEENQKGFVETLIGVQE